MTSAAAWMQARGWKQKLAKRRAYEQSSFDHSLIELDVLLELLKRRRRGALKRLLVERGET